jgi:phosphatidate cytidylyltransferase
VLLALAGVVGDLAESLLKRDAQRKDSSTWLQGLGGVLDIVDALLLAGPVAWLCWEAGLVGPGR